ncbi:MAG: ABC transporter ATP-binding protein [Dehalococcoidia bacterium]
MHAATGAQVRGADRGSRLIQASGVRKVYAAPRGSVVALDEISLEIGAGEFVALLGPSGCGKSTLLNILGGLMAPSAGQVSIDGDRPRPRRDVGMMFQQSLLFPWRTVLQNVRLPAELLGLPREAAKQRAQELLSLVGLDGWELRYPWELSGGMQQRVALARVLLPDPDILLLDEPFGSLDEMTRESLDVELMRIAAMTTKTVIFVTHNVYEAVLMADRIYVFTKRPGRIAGIVDVGFARPRGLETSGTAAFADKVAEVRAFLTETAL